MQAEPHMMVIPLTTDPDGTLRVSATRVTLDTLIGFYQQGYTPEELHESFDSVPLSAIYVVIGYYLAHRDAIDAYLVRRDAEAEQLRAQFEAELTPEQRATRERWRALIAAN